MKNKFKLYDIVEGKEETVSNILLTQHGVIIDDTSTMRLEYGLHRYRVEFKDRDIRWAMDSDLRLIKRPFFGGTGYRWRKHRMERIWWIAIGLSLAYIWSYVWNQLWV